MISKSSVVFIALSQTDLHTFGEGGGAGADCEFVIH